MLDYFKLRVPNSTISCNHEVPWYSVSQTEPPFPRHPVSTEIQRFRFQDGGAPHLSVLLMKLEAIVLK